MELLVSLCLSKMIFRRTILFQKANESRGGLLECVCTFHRNFPDSIHQSWDKVGIFQIRD